MGIFCSYKFLMDIFGYICFCFLNLCEKIACNCGGLCDTLLGVDLKRAASDSAGHKLNTTNFGRLRGCSKEPESTTQAAIYAKWSDSHEQTDNDHGGKRPPL
jgi:hypothetical protein